jgi:hypothetical protein
LATAGLTWLAKCGMPDDHISVYKRVV